MGYRKIDCMDIMHLASCGRTYNEISKLLGISKGTVSNKLKEAREKAQENGLSPDMYSSVAFYRAEQQKLIVERDKMKTDTAQYARLSRLILDSQARIDQLCRLTGQAVETSTHYDLKKVDIVINDVIRERSARPPLGESECE